MNKHDDFLVEILTEELPPKALLTLAEAFRAQITERLQKAGLAFSDADYFATPRRLAVLVHQLQAAQPDQEIERKGPAVSAAFDATGKPSQACIGFAKSCGVLPEELKTIKTDQGEWVGIRQKIAGKTAQALLPDIVNQAAMALPIPKRMRWGASDVQFVRPVHAVIMLYGEEVIPATILGCVADRVTYGHRFLAPQAIEISKPSDYATFLEMQGKVIADFTKRREKILELSQMTVYQLVAKETEVNPASLVKIQLQADFKPLFNEALLDEVTGIVEWPVALLGSFDKDFLEIPQEVLISAMQDHQRYFPLVDDNGRLLPYFVTISNIESKNPKRVIGGNERVLRARLSDAAFFFITDQSESLEQRLERLKNIVYQAKLGTLYDKAERLSQMTAFIAKQMSIDIDLAERAGWLAKTDLTTNMVGEFPELQGVMGRYYAEATEEPEVAVAMQEQYFPRFAGDMLPATAIGQALAIADKIDAIVGSFGISQIPTGDKDPYGLRRAALGVLRILLEKKMDLDLQTMIEAAKASYKAPLENTETVPQVLNFIQERLRALYVDQGVSPDVFAAVAALGITKPLDFDARIRAVQRFKTLTEASMLSSANKRVSNIIAKYTETIVATKVDKTFFENPAEHELDQQLEAKQQIVDNLVRDGQYEEVLIQLAGLQKPVDHFFEQVMVMVPEQERRENRMLLLTKLRQLFLQVADIALLQ